jgi:hypothetical protein
MSKFYVHLFHWISPPKKNWEVSTDQWLRGLHFEKDQCLGNLGGGYAKLSLQDEFKKNFPKRWQPPV